MEDISRGDIVWVDFNNYFGNIQGGLRPALVLQNNKGNKFSPTIVIVPITSSLTKNDLPIHVVLENTKGLEKKSIALIEQIRTLDKRRLIKKITNISSIDLEKVKEAIKKNLNIRGIDIF